MLRASGGPQGVSADSFSRHAAPDTPLLRHGIAYFLHQVKYLLRVGYLRTRHAHLFFARRIIIMKIIIIIVIITITTFCLVPQLTPERAAGYLKTLRAKPRDDKKHNWQRFAANFPNTKAGRMEFD